MKRTIICILLILIIIAAAIYYICMQRDKFENEKNEAVAAAVQYTIDSINEQRVLEVPVQQTMTQTPPPPPPAKIKVEPEAEPIEADVLVDERDGQDYKILEADGIWWMAENLNFPTEESWCYKVEESNCDKWGRLYSWKAASTACPKGWHLPDDHEWLSLIDYYGGVHYAGKILKEGGGSGFNVLMSGYYYHKGSFGKVGVSSYHWSSTDQDENYASFKGIYSTVDNVGTYTYIKVDGMSVRCVKDH